jgi:hypothetical protein
MSVPSPLAIVLVLVVLDIERGSGMQCRNNPELASMVLHMGWVKHFSTTRTTTRTIIAGRATCLLAPALITDLLITDYSPPYPPPPGVSTTMQSPGATSRWSQLCSTSTRPSVRKMKVRPT